MRLLKILVLGVLTLGILNTRAQSPTVVDAVYVKKLDNWQRNMTHWKLKNFVPLVGLYLLKEGENTFGKNPENDIVIDSRHAPDFMGSIVKKGSEVSFISHNGKEVELGEKKLAQITYTFDEDRNSEKLNLKFIKWYIQFVSDDYFLRVIDDQSPLVKSFEPFSYFEANENMIFTAHYTAFENSQSYLLDNVIATKQAHNFIGEITFTYKDQEQKLMVLDGYFLMFADQTNGIETFPYGKYLRIPPPDEKGEMIVDFNYSFSPPRSVSLYTTCDLPPANNRLSFRVEAGEQFVQPDNPIIRPVER